MIPKKRDSKVRKAIFRGIYEENLKITGRHTKTLSVNAPYRLKKMFLFLAVICLVVLGQGSYLNVTLLPESGMTAGIIKQKNDTQSAEKSADPLEYKAFLGNPTMSLSRMFGLEVKTIMIDPGHGGADNGSTGKMGTKEKDITLDIAKRLGERLKKHGKYNVLMTREQDVTLPLNQRVESANSNRADLFISIHLNYLPTRPINIIETYYFGQPYDDSTLKLAEKENAGSHYNLSEFKEIIEKIGETMKLQESKKLATSIQKNLFLNSKRHNVKVYDFGIKRAPFIVLLGVDVPAVLAEVSCLSNKTEETELNTERHRENIAHYLEAGILDYLNKGEASYETKGYAERR